MTGQILVVTSQGDAHVDMMTELLRREGHDPVVMYPDRLLYDGSLTVHVDGARWNGVWDSGQTGGLIALDTVRVVWWQNPRPVVVPDSIPDRDRYFAKQEAEHTLSGVWQLLASDESVYWMSDPERIREAENRVEQLHRAVNVGLRVPKSIVTNDPDHVEGFHQECGGMTVYKPMTGRLPGGQPLRTFEANVTSPRRTSIVDDARLTKLEAVRVTACLFQELVPKQRELRVTVFDDQVFTCAFSSQEGEQSSTGRRYHDTVSPCAAEQLPDELQDKCVQFLRSYGLKFGTFDFILTPEGEYVFLEMNPNGQWMFLQERIPELAMAQTLAGILAKNTK